MNDEPIKACDHPDRAETEGAQMKHDIIVRDGERIVDVRKGDGSEPRPHVMCCAGCRKEGVCHGCGVDVSRNNPTNFRGRCTSGACATCCNRLHRHPLG